MTEIKLTATPSNPQWKDLSDRHKRNREQLEDALTRFSTGEGTQVKGIVGAYGSGKSELMSWGFKFSWTELHLPAIYITLESLLDYLRPNQLGPNELVSKVGDFLQKQTEQISKNMSHLPRPDGICLATDIKPDQTFSDYFLQLFGDQNLDLNIVHNAFRKGRVVLFVDEIEQKYGELIEHIETSDQAPLRELLQAVEQGIVPYYMVMSFGLSSAYETMSGADARRFDTLTLSIPDPFELNKIGQLGGYQNLIWWASRGRPGWAVKFANEWVQNLTNISVLEQVRDLTSNALIDRMPVIEVNTLNSAFSSTTVNKIMTQLLKSIAPIPVSQLNIQSGNIKNILDQLPPYQFLVAEKEQDLVLVNDLVDTFIKDMSVFSQTLHTGDIEWSQIRAYLHKVLNAFANQDERIAFGGWTEKISYFAEAAMTPLLILLRDMILEFEGDRSETAGTLSFLDKVMEECTIIGDKIEKPREILSVFRETSKLCKEVYEFNSASFISISPKAVEGLFPRIVGRPLMTIHSKVESSIHEQQITLGASVSESKQFVFTDYTTDSATIRFIFIPTQNTLEALDSKYFSRNHRDQYLNHNLVYVLVPLFDASDLGFDLVNNPDIKVLNDLKKIIWYPLGQKHIQDFVVSLWRNWNVYPNRDVNINDLFEILGTFYGIPELSKSNRRKLEYYRSRLTERIRDIAINSTRNFNHVLKELFDPKDDRFPNERIGETLEKVRINRAIEQIMLAFDVQRHNETLQFLHELRQLNQLREATSGQPAKAYKEFLDRFTVKTTRGEVESGTNLANITNYINDRSGFRKLLAVARELGLEPGQEWEASSDGTNSAPLLVLYRECGKPQETFIRAVSLYSYLSDNKQTFLDELNDFEDKFSQLSINLETLKTDISDFNEKLGNNIIVATDIDELLDEVKKLHELIETAHLLPPSAIYILYRFTEATYEPVEQKRQRWQHSEQGLPGWNKSFEKMLNWRKHIEDFSSDIEFAYKDNSILKKEILGSADNYIKNIKKTLETAAQESLKQIDKTNKLSDGKPPDQNVAVPYEDALPQIQDKVDDIVDRAREIDELIADLDQVKEQIESVIQQLGA